MPVILGGPRVYNIALNWHFVTRYEDAESAPKRTYIPTSMLKSQNFSGDDTADPRIKRGEEGWEGKGIGRGGKELGGLGREGIGVWPTQKLSHGAPYVRTL
jgi:hypothetical protein